MQKINNIIYDVVVVAGGKKASLQDLIGTDVRALAILNGRRLLDYIIEPLKKSKYIGKIVVVVDEDVVAKMPSIEGVEVCAGGNNMPESAKAGVEHLGSQGRVFFICDDIPFVTQEAIEDFLTQVEQLQGECFYPIIPKINCLEKYPNFKRTYFTLKDGCFTGGNMMVLDTKIISQGMIKANEIFARRKSPMKLASLIGWSFVVKFVLRLASSKDIVNRASDILSFECNKIISHYPEIGMDIDKKEDWLAAEAMLEKEDK